LLNSFPINQKPTKVTTLYLDTNIVNFMRYFVFILIFFACSPIKRHQRLVNKYPFVHTTDSVKLIDTIRITTNKVVSDTVVHESLLFDTIILTKDNLSVKVLKIRDSVYINGECDTIFIDKVIERKIPVKYYETKNEINTSLLIWVISLGLLIIFYVLNKLK